MFYIKKSQAWVLICCSLRCHLFQKFFYWIMVSVVCFWLICCYICFCFFHLVLRGGEAGPPALEQSPGEQEPCCSSSKVPLGVVAVPQPLHVDGQVVLLCLPLVLGEVIQPQLASCWGLRNDCEWYQAKGKHTTYFARRHEIALKERLLGQYLQGQRKKKYPSSCENKWNCM